MVFSVACKLPELSSFPWQWTEVWVFERNCFERILDRCEPREVCFATLISLQTLLESERGPVILAGAKATNLGIILASSLPLISTSNCQQTLLVRLQNTPSICLFLTIGHR